VYYLQLLRARSTIFPNASNFGTPQPPLSVQRRKDSDKNDLNSRRSSRFTSSSLLDGIYETSVQQAVEENDNNKELLCTPLPIYRKQPLPPMKLPNIVLVLTLNAVDA
jgi:hypothetical protein